MSDASLISAVFVAVFVAFYLMFIRPIHKEQARHRKQMQDLRTGDQVLTTSNFIARIKDIQVPEEGPTRIWLELADGVVFVALPAAILQRLEPEKQALERQGVATSGPGQASV
jgi:preprotein translocase YajC subunit